MGSLRNEVWPSQIEQETCEIMRHQLVLRNKQVGKEAKRCIKYGDAISVMFKKYREISSSTVNKVNEMAS